MTATNTMQAGASRQDRIYNFASCLIDATGFPLGTAFFSTATILPVLLRRLGSSDVVIGCLPALANLLIFLPGFLVVGYLNRRRRVRGYLFWVAVAERLALLPLAPLTALWGLAHPQWLIAAVFACIGGNTFLMGLNQPSYWVAVGKTVPPHWRGRLFGFAGGISGVLSLFVDRIMTHLLGDRSGGFPHGFSVCFLIGFSILIVTVLPLGRLREPNFEPDKQDTPGLGAYVRQMWEVWRENPGFRRFLYGNCAFQLSTLATPFYILYAARHLGAGPAAIAGFTATVVFVSSFAGLGWGAWADRGGNKIILLWSSVLAVLAAACAAVAGSQVAFYGVFALLALSTAGAGIAGFNIVMEFAGEPRRIPLYAATANAVTAIPRAIAPIVGGIIATATGEYRTDFYVAAMFAAISLVLTLRFAEPRSVERVKTP